MGKINRVVCAVSGGVDSAVAALLLKRRGFSVVGVHMVNWDYHDELGKFTGCQSPTDETDARKLCQQLDIEFHSVNFVKEFWCNVFVRFLDNYRKGRTVVPDVDCNRLIKFDLLHKCAFQNLDADAVATGHYATTSQGDFLERYSELRLLRAKDRLKDQTYFLSSLKATQLRRMLFPLGSMTKPQVRELAERGDLCVARKDEYIEPVTGVFVDIDSNETIIGAIHSGVHNFTVGKRISERWNLPRLLPNSEGLFVTGLDHQTQTVYFCRGSHHPKLFARKLLVGPVSWISDRVEEENGSGGKWPLTLCIQRTHPPIPCRLSSADLPDNTSVLETWFPIRAVAHGQVCVFYSQDGQECLGCGEVQEIIEKL